jgi:hypothetical protein
MKTIQGMVAQYFIMKNLTSHQQHIEFVSSFNKLKEVSNKITTNMTTNAVTQTQTPEKTDKAKYNDRKKLGISTCLENLEKTHTNDEWVKFFNKHSKRDDLADCFLQGIWYIKNKL